MRTPELLAPAGGRAALIAAVQSGADAVYLGADRFSARSGADNFTLDTLGEWIDYCHLRGVKVHLAANTLVTEREINDFIHYVSEAYRLGIDAVIIQDLGMAERIKQLLPELELHASTQMTVSTAEGVKALEERGFSRVVLARELTAEEIRRIRQTTDIELEMFVHGALCFSYSGQCLMSSIIGQRSGNRGMCAQPCRLPYELVSNGKTAAQGYLMSPKDLCLLDSIADLVALGIDSFKIEGRLKSAGYVATAVGVYRKAIDGIAVTDSDRAALLDAFNRSGFTEGWYGGGKNMMSGSSPSNVAAGKTAAEYAKFTDVNANYRKIGIDIFAELKEGMPLSVTFLDGDGNSAAAFGEIPAERAERVPLTYERLKTQLEKLGSSVFEAKSCEITLEDGIVIPIGEINAVRRAAAEQLAAKRLERVNREIKPFSKELAKRTAKQMYLVAVCRTKEQVQAAKKCGVERVISPQELEDTVMLANAVGIGKAPESDGVMVMNLAQSRAFSGKKQFGGFRLNVTNSETLAALSNMAAVTLSPELNLKDIKEIVGDTPCEVIAYGRLALMLMRKCPSQASGKCSGRGGFSLLDRRKESFPIVCGEGCTSQLLNSKPIYMADKLSDLANAGVDGLQLWFWEESAEEVTRIIGEYSGKREPILPKEFTRGHFYRGFGNK